MNNLFKKTILFSAITFLSMQSNYTMFLALKAAGLINSKNTKNDEIKEMEAQITAINDRSSKIKKDLNEARQQMHQMADLIIAVLRNRNQPTA